MFRPLKVQFKRSSVRQEVNAEIGQEGIVVKKFSLGGQSNLPPVADKIRQNEVR